jgi:hypothetical protein
MPLKAPARLIRDDRLTSDDDDFINELNASVDRLSELRALDINVSGKFLRSKIAWNLAAYQHHFCTAW